MFQKIKELSEAARLKYLVWKREREERKAERAATPYRPNDREIGFDRNPRRIRFAVLLATWGVVGFLILWVAQTVGDLRLFFDVNLKFGEPIIVDYDVAFNGDLLSLIVLSIVSFAIVFYSKAWVSYFMDTPWRDWGSKSLSLMLGIGGSAAIVMGGFEVNQHIRQEDFRGALVGQQSAEQGRAATQGQIDAIDDRLASMRDQARVGVYAAIAASVGTAAYDSDYLSAEAMARTDPQRRDLVRRARGAAVAADALEAQKLQLIGQLAAATPAAATAAVVEMNDPVSRFIGELGPWRIVLLVVVGDLILLFGTYLADKREERMRYAGSVDASGWADEGHRIEDLRTQPRVTPEPMEPHRETVYDADTGEELVPRRATWAKKPKRKGKPEKVSIPGEERGPAVDRVTNADGTVTEIERGVDGYGTGRIAVGADGLGGVMESVGAGEGAGGDQGDSDSAANNDQPTVPDSAEQKADSNESSRDLEYVNPTHPEPSEPEMSEDELREVYPELATAELSDEPIEPTVVVDGVIEDAAENHTEEESQHHEPREPETNPARLLAAE